MATLYSDIGNDQTPLEAADTWTRNNGNEETGNILIIDAVYTLTAGTDEASADLLNVCKIPANARVIPHMCKIVAENPGTAFNIATIGTALVDPNGAATADADKFSTAVNISAGGAFDFAYAAQAGGLVGSNETEPMWLQVVLGTVTAPTAGQTVRFLVALSVAV